MKVLILQDDLFGYLQHIFRAYTSNGIDPEEALAVYQFNQALKSVQTVDEAQVAKIKATEVGPISDGMGTHPEV